jgi:hypothetical protein
VSNFFRVGVEEEVEMLPYAGVRSVSIERCQSNVVVHSLFIPTPKLVTLSGFTGYYYCKFSCSSLLVENISRI